MKKNDEQLLEEFKKVEEQIRSDLKKAELSIDGQLDRKTIVANIKSYIKQVKHIEKLLEDYENLAKQIADYSGDDEKEEKITDAVVELREDSPELKTEIENINGQIIVKTKKKKSGEVTKEL